MKTYTVTELSNQPKEIFDRANQEPILLVHQSEPTHVIMSLNSYQQIVARLQQLEDDLLGQLASKALSESSLVGSVEFTKNLEKLAHGKA